MVPEAGAFFGRRMIIFQERYRRFVTPYVLRSIAVSPQPGCFEEAEKVRRLAAMNPAGMNGCQETPRSEKLDGKKLHGAAWWRVRSRAERIRFFLYISTGGNTTLTSIYRCGIMLVLKGVVLLHGHLYCCTLPDCLISSQTVLLYTRTNRVTFERKSHLLTRA